MKNNAKNEKCVYWNDGFFFRVNFEHVLKMAVKMNFLCKNCAKSTLKMKSVDTGKMAFSLGSIFNIFKIC